MVNAELHSRIYALLADRSSMPDGDEWEHEPLRRLTADLVRAVHDTSFERVCNGCEADRKAAS